MLFDPGVVDTAHLFACWVECSCNSGCVGDMDCMLDTSYALLSHEILSSFVLDLPRLSIDTSQPVSEKFWAASKPIPVLTPVMKMTDLLRSDSKTKLVVDGSRRWQCVMW